MSLDSACAQIAEVLIPQVGGESLLAFSFLAYWFLGAGQGSSIL